MFSAGRTSLFPNLVNDFRFGFLRNYSFAATAALRAAANGGPVCSRHSPGSQIGGGVPLTTFSNFSFLGSPDFLPKKQIPQLLQYNDTVSITHGTQTFKLGVSVYGPMRNIFQDEGGTRGDLTFTGVFTAASPTLTVCSDRRRAHSSPTSYLSISGCGWLPASVEDDWKVTPKLTLNLGLRYDFATPALAGNNKMANFNPAGSGSLVFAKSGSIQDRSLVQPNTKNFGPRFGVSLLA